MPWFGVSIIAVMRVLEGEQTSFPVFEDINLIEAIDEDDACRQAKELGARNYLDDPTETLDGIPARMSFAGVRKICAVLNNAAADDERPDSLSEITYSQFSLSSESDIESLIRGEAVIVEYRV